ncbi:hypothetical protein GUJ93_ZPchr0012g19241 [Zizania palustris]|uniref:Uncharacterized protein n=1 Tax=Zizania palustris TaxID=103762 RepID=A0A8J5WJF6_ZIZPA|nr:hypothetical protein GUJ93_ZPchr0012g19241 [Zizania palustris]
MVGALSSSSAHVDLTVPVELYAPVPPAATTQVQNVGSPLFNCLSLWKGASCSSTHRLAWGPHSLPLQRSPKEVSPSAQKSIKLSTHGAPQAFVASSHIHSPVVGHKPSVFARLQSADGSLWTMVRRRYWWRQKPIRPMPLAQQPKDLRSLRHQNFLHAMSGKCFNCLSRDHKVAVC